MRILAALLCVGLSGCMSFGAVKQTALHIEMDGISCSATAVGPHVFLSAAHCFEWPYTLAIHGQPVAVTRVMLDGNDHIIVMVAYTFDHWALLGAASQGEPVYIIGNPGDWTQQFRRGYVAGEAEVWGTLATTYDLRIFPGDSGSGIFNTDNQLTGVISFVHKSEDDSGQLTMAGSWPLAFTAEQWEEARR